MISKLRKKELKNVITELLNKNLYMKITKFLTVYCGVNERVINNKIVSHKDISFLLPNLKRISYDDALNNIEAFYRGELIIVIDSYGNIAPYVTPIIDNKNISDSEQEDEEYSEIDIEIYVENEDCDTVKDAISDENLSRYELAILCKYYRKNQQYSKYRATRELLKSKKDEENVEKYKNKKLELRMKGREEDD